MPAVMSSREAPSWMALRMSELMKAEHCSPNLSGPLRLYRDVADVAHVGDVEVAGGRFLEERAGPGRAGLVHRVVDGDPVLQQGVLGVLPADLENGVDVGLEVGGAHSVGDDLVVHRRRFQEHAQDLPRGTGRGREGDVDRGVADLLFELFLHFDQAFFQRVDRVAVGPPVMGRHDLVGLDVDERNLGGGRAAVDAENIFAARPRRAAASIAR